MRKVILALAAIFIINLVGIYYGWYDFFWFDMVLHFTGGLFWALLFSLYLKAHLLPNAKIANMLIIVGTTMIIGIVWEFAEYLANQTFSETASATLGIRVDFMGNLDDTITDLLMDMLGAILATGIHMNTTRQ